MRWAADLIGLSVIWYVVGPAIAATIGLGWGSVGLGTLPVEVGGARPRTWWRVALIVEATAMAGMALFVGLGPSHFGFRRTASVPSGYSIRLGGQIWASASARGGLVATLMVTVDLAAVLVVLTAVTLTRRWAQAQLDAARPVEPGAAGLGAAPTAPRLPAQPAMSMSVVTEDPPWDPAETDEAWGTVGARPDEDPLRP